MHTTPTRVTSTSLSKRTAAQVTPTACRIPATQRRAKGHHSSMSKAPNAPPKQRQTVLYSLGRISQVKPTQSTAETQSHTVPPQNGCITKQGLKARPIPAWAEGPGQAQKRSKARRAAPYSRQQRPSEKTELPTPTSCRGKNSPCKRRPGQTHRTSKSPKGRTILKATTPVTPRSRLTVPPPAHFHSPPAACRCAHAAPQQTATTTPPIPCPHPQPAPAAGSPATTSGRHPMTRRCHLDPL